MFQPITNFTLGAYFADEAAYAKVFTDAGQAPFPGHKDSGLPTKTWSAPQNQTYKWGGLDKPGYLVVAEGQSVQVVDQKGGGEQFVFTTPIVPPELGQLLTNFQHDFYVEYRNHPDYSQGIPLLAVVQWSGEWLTRLNFAPVGAHGRVMPPINQGKLMNWGMRFKPGSTQKRLEDVEVFPIEQYRAQFKPPSAQPKPAGEYTYSNAALAAAAMGVLFAEGTNDAKGAAIRALAEARK